MNGSESLASFLASTQDTISETNSPVSQEQALLESSLMSLSHFAHDRAKDIIDRERELIKMKLSEAASQSSKSKGASPSKALLSARVSSPIHNQRTNWVVLLNALSTLSNVEKDYWNLTFVGGTPSSGGLGGAFQSLFTRRRETSLKDNCQYILSELKKLDADSKFSKSVLETPSEEGFLSERLLTHLSQQLQSYVTAKLRLVEFYEQMHVLASTSATNIPSSGNLVKCSGGNIAGDLNVVLSHIIQTYSKAFHHPILAPLSNLFSTECEILQNLFKAQVEILKCSFLTSLLHLNHANRKLSDMDLMISMGTKNGSRTLVPGNVAKKIGPSVANSLPLYAWLWKFKAALLSKFTFYFYESLAKQAINEADLKPLTAKADVDFVGRIAAFVKKSDAHSVSLVYDATSSPETLKVGI